MADLSEKTLVLNKSWVPIATISLKQAVKIISRGHGKIIDPDDWQLYSWEEWLKNTKPLTDERKINAEFYIRTSNFYIPIPEIIVLSGFSRVPPMGIHFTRLALYERDNYICQYCGKAARKAELTMDHVVPKSKGGHTTWENCVTCCHKCNQIKADLSLDECNMKLAKKPTKPHSRQLVLRTKHVKESWRNFLKEEHLPKE